LPKYKSGHDMMEFPVMRDEAGIRTGSASGP
jgi:hypothetical protein